MSERYLEVAFAVVLYLLAMAAVLWVLRRDYGRARAWDLDAEIDKSDYFISTQKQYEGSTMYAGHKLRLSVLKLLRILRDMLFKPNVVYAVYAAEHTEVEGVWRLYDEAVAYATDKLMTEVRGRNVEAADEVTLRTELWDQDLAEIWGGVRCWRVLVELPVGERMVVVDHMYVVEMVVR